MKRPSNEKIVETMKKRKEEAAGGEAIYRPGDFFFSRGQTFYVNDDKKIVKVPRDDNASVINHLKKK